MTTPTTLPPPSPVRWPILAGVWLLYCCFGVTAAGMAPLVAPITRDLEISHSVMGGVLGVWQLVYIAASIPCGLLLDRLGARWALFIGALLIAASGLFRSVAPDAVALCLAVGVFGLGGPIVSAGSPKVVSQWFEGSARGFAMGVYLTGPSIGGIVALSLTNSVLMPWLDDSWRGVLRIWALFTLVSAFAWLALASLPAARQMERKLAAEPKLPEWQVLKSLLALPALRLVLLMSIGIFLFNHGLNNWLPELLRASGMTASEAGYWSSIPTAVAIFCSLLIPRLATPRRRLWMLALLCCAAGTASLLLHAGPGLILMAGLLIQGIARGALMAVTMLTLVELPGVAGRHVGVASGLFFSAAEIGGASGPLLLGLLYDATGGFHAGLYLLTAVAALLLLATWRLSRRVDLTAPAKPD